MVISILIPYRATSERAALWDHCRAIWDQLPYEICIGTDTGVGPFNAAMAFNDAHTKATGDKLIMYGADQLPDLEQIEWVSPLLETHPWVPLFAGTGTYSAENTTAILAGANPDWMPYQQQTRTCIAIIGVRADSWIPYDERFTGWGSEDTAWKTALEVIHPHDVPTSHGLLRCLYHTPAPRDHAETNYNLLLEYQQARDAGTMREYLANVLPKTAHQHDPKSLSQTST